MGVEANGASPSALPNGDGDTFEGAFLKMRDAFLAYREGMGGAHDHDYAGSSVDGLICDRVEWVDPDGVDNQTQTNQGGKTV